MMNYYLRVIVAVVIAVMPAVTLGAYGGGNASSINNNTSLQKDYCPNGDYSPSYYDNDCGNSLTDDDDAQTQGVMLGGYVFNDTNANGMRDTGEYGYQGATVTLKTGNGSYLAMDMTDSSGYYSFDGLMPGTYRVNISLPLSQNIYQRALSLFVGSVHAATEYEFTVVISDDGEDVSAGNTPVVDGEIGGSYDDSDTDSETDAQYDNQNELDILAIISNSNQGATAMPTGMTTTTSAGATNGFVLPANLPNTGAGL